MALGFDIPSIGLFLVAFGAIMLLAAAAKRTGKYNRGDVLIAGGVVAIAGIFMGGFAALAGLSAAPGIPEPPAPGALWNIQMTRVVFWDTASTDGVAVTGGTGIIEPTQGLVADIYAARADLDDAGSALDVDITMINLNEGDSTVTWQIVMQLGAFDSVKDPSAGTSYPLVSPDDADPNIGEVTYTDAGADGSRVGALFYDVVATAASEVTEAEISLVDITPFAAMVVGQAYSLSVIAGGVTLTVNIHATA